MRYAAIYVTSWKLVVTSLVQAQVMSVNLANLYLSGPADTGARVCKQGRSMVNKTYDIDWISQALVHVNATV